MKFTLGPWKLVVDPEATRGCYEQCETGWGLGCNCGPCENLKSVRSHAYPVDGLEIFRELGIDPWKPFEISWHCREQSGLHLYGGWHYICGYVENLQTVGRGIQHRLNSTFEIALTQREKVRQPFSAFTCIQIDFYCKLPWLSRLTEPD
jgi:hypothetical protein